MKKILFAIVLSVVSAVQINAQNIQLHYDFGGDLYDELGTRPSLTTTVEMFKPDKWGSTFFFVDMDYAKNEVASAYWELARELKFWKAPISVHVEYDGGINYIKDSYLAGATYTFNNKDFTKGFSASVMYKYIHSNPSPNNFQFTATWYLHFGQGKYSFTGFMDFWRERHNSGNGKSHLLTFLAEPQFWVNLNAFPWADDDFKLSVGTVSGRFHLILL